jgi:hypothetical protein
MTHFFCENRLTSAHASNSAISHRSPGRARDRPVIDTTGPFRLVIPTAAAPKRLESPPRRGYDGGAMRSFDAADSRIEVVLVVPDETHGRRDGAFSLFAFARRQGDVARCSSSARSSPVRLFLPSGLQATDGARRLRSPPSPFLTDPSDDAARLRAARRPAARSICDLGHKIIFSPDV